MTDECEHSPMEEHLSQVRQNILKFGWHVTGVLPEPGSLAFTYTVGLTRFQDHPELIMLSLPNRQAQELLNILGGRVRDGTRLEPGRLEAGVSPIKDYPVWLIPVDDWVSHPLGVAKAIYGVEITALQVVWPDSSGRFPWEDGYNHVGCPQPLLGPPPSGQDGNPV